MKESEPERKVDMAKRSMWRAVTMMLVAGAVCAFDDPETSGESAKSTAQKSLIVSHEAIRKVGLARLQEAAEEQDAVLVSPQMIPARSQLICDMDTLAAIMGWMWAACKTEYYCDSRMSITILVGGQNTVCQYDCNKPVTGKKCDCDLRAGQHALCPK